MKVEAVSVGYKFPLNTRTKRKIYEKKDSHYNDFPLRPPGTVSGALMLCGAAYIPEPGAVFS